MSLGLSIELRDGDKQFFLPPNDRSLKVDGVWVDPGMMGDGIPYVFDQIGELCAALAVRDLKEFVLPEDLQMDMEELEEELEELEDEDEGGEEVTELKRKIMTMQPWHEPSECLVTVRALIAHLEPNLMPDPDEMTGTILPDSFGLPAYFVWHLRTYEKVLEEAEAKGWTFYFEIMS